MPQISSAAIVAAQAAHKFYYPLGPFASVTLAQWIVESDWGRSIPSGSNNFFGIKAVAGEPYVETMTREVIDGVSKEIPQRFAKYDGVSDAFFAHAKLLATSPIYRAAQQATTPDAYVWAMAPQYENTPYYAYVLLSVMHYYNLYKYDIPVTSVTSGKQTASEGNAAAPSPVSSSATANGSTEMATTAQSLSWLQSIFGLIPEAEEEFAKLQADPIVQTLEALGAKYLVHTPTPGQSVVVEPASTT